ncbi:hypothetical protein R3W88_029641 [Solanum pinnatisectum]|uniref:Retrotransposon gag domain-containing protein n=1 Tax=Solanum pinnatisectum TaxID=50273 RepID=A0AAV9K5Y8_9SOLN|nr:hypothetical protein R3W88_029641 [Solanum pinnatisectum]
MDFIGLRIFPLSLTADAAMWFSELTYNSIYTWDQLHKVFMERYFSVSKKLNHKDKLYNFTALLGKSVSSSWDRFTGFMRSVPNHRIDDELLKKYFYKWQDDNGKAVLDTIARGSYGEQGVFELAFKVPTRIISAKVKETRTRTMETTTKMMKRFDVTDENVKEIRNDLSGIGQKVDAHAVSIKQLEQQFSQLSAATIDPPMPSEVERVIEKDEDDIEVIEDPKVYTEKEAEVTQKVVPMPRPPPPFPQRLVKKIEEGKYRRFIAMLKQLFINVPLIEAPE